MKAPLIILLFIICLNLSTGLVVELGLPGTAFVSPSKPETTDYAAHFNATEIAEQWQPTYQTGIPIIGDVYSMFQFLWRLIQYAVVGFPLFINSMGDAFITDAGARVAYNAFTAVLFALWSITFAIFGIAFISGREVT